jgi:hypothetical protein
MKFESKEVDAQSVYLNLRFCQFVEGIDFLHNSLCGCIDVILLTECIFADVYRLCPCFDPSLNPISDWNLQIEFYCKNEVMIRNIELICLINANDQKKSESSVCEKQYFSSSVLFLETDNIFEMVIEGSDSVFVLNVSENSKSELFLDRESENESDNEEEKEMIVGDMENIREFLKSGGGSKSEDSSSFSERKSTEVIEIANSVEIIATNDLDNCKSLKRIIFSSGNHLRKIAGFGGCTSLCRIEIPSSVEVIENFGFQGCTSLNEMYFSPDSDLRVIGGFSRCTSLCQITIPSSVETIDWNGFFGCTSLNELFFHRAVI